MSQRLRWLAGQYARPSGLAGRWLFGRWLDRISQEMNALTFEELRLQREHDVLEIGFGGGGLLDQILGATSGRVAGVDLSSTMVARARRRFRGRAQLSLYLGSVERLPFAEGSFDRVCSVNNIYFWPDPGAALAQVARVLRPGGTFTIAFEPPEELRKWPGHRYGFGLFAAEDVARLMINAGFADLRCVEGQGRQPDHFLCLTGRLAGAEAAR